jgi:malonate transporter
MLGAVNSSVLSSLVPVVLLIGAGFLAGRRGWVTGGAVRDLSNLIFLLLAPALLFRTMSTVHVEQLKLGPVAAYFLAAGLIFAATLVVRGFNRTSAVIALANTFSNTVMIGIPLVGLAFGPEGMVVLLTLISLHSLVLLTSATLVLELAVAREQARQPGGERTPILRTLGRAFYNAIVHPVPLPIIAGLLFAQTGLSLPESVDKPIAWLGQAFGPIALVMVGITLTQALIKNLAHPALVALLGWLLGLRGLPLQVMVVAAALPIGANVFLFSQRYKTAEDLVTASVAVSTALALVTVSIVMALVGSL